MNELEISEKTKAAPQFWILRAALLVFAFGAIVSTLILICLKTPLKEHLVGLWLFAGSFLSWVVVYFKLKKKGYLDQLGTDISDKEGKEMENLTGEE